MESLFHIEFEVWGTISGKMFVTESREEVTDYFEKGWNVSEKHITISKPAAFSSVWLETATLWTEKQNGAIK